MTERGTIFTPDNAHKIALNLKDVTRRIGERYVKWQPGDILVVREKWRIRSWHVPMFMHSNPLRDVWIEFEDGEKVFRKISFDDAPKLFSSEDGANKFFGWRSPLHMYHWAARSRGPIVSVRSEPLHAIDDADAIREGIPADHPNPRQAFIELWDSIYGKTDLAWKHNREVVRLEFSKTP